MNMHSCSHCKQRAVIQRKYEGTYLCKNHFMRSVEHTVKKTIRENNLIERHDHIAVGFSGGKDSSVLLYLLSQIAKNRDDLKISAILINEGISGYREYSLPKAKAFCKKLNVNLEVVEVEKKVGKTIDMIMHDKAKDPKLRACTYCGAFRRTYINEAARKIGATKVAIGHNLDDEVQSIMANYLKGDVLRGARLGTTTGTVHDERFIPRIKPLLNVPEKEVGLYAVLKGFKFDANECPYAKESFRWAVRDMINDLEVKYPGTKFNILRTFEKIQPALKLLSEKSVIGTCKLCKEPSSNEICKTCQLKMQVNHESP